MAGPTPSWNTVPLFGTWRNYDGTLKSGAYKVTSAVRVTNTTDDVIVPAGLVASGTLNEKEATGGAQTHSLYLDVPASDDPDNDVRGWQLTIEVTFKDSPGEKYVIDTPLSALNNAPSGINLRKVILLQTLPAPQPVLIKGVPGGIAVYDKDGDVVDAAGNKVISGSGDGASGPTNSSNITDATTLGKSLLTVNDAATARTLIGAKPNTYLPAWSEIQGKPATFAPSGHSHTSGDLVDASTLAKQILTSPDATTVRGLIGAGTGNGTSNLQLGATSTTAAAGDHLHTGVYTTPADVDAKVQGALKSAAPQIPAGAKAPYYVIHGANAATARPTTDTATTVYVWVGSVPPTNMTGDDQWVNTTP